MKIPSKFTFYGKTWTVKFQSPADPDRPTAWAMTSLRTQTIYLDPNFARGVIEQCFIHECLHIIVSEQGLDVSLGWNGDDEEKVVNSMANGFYHLLKTNVLKFMNDPATELKHGIRPFIG